MCRFPTSISHRSVSQVVGYSFGPFRAPKAVLPLYCWPGPFRPHLHKRICYNPLSIPLFNAWAFGARLCAWSTRHDRALAPAAHLLAPHPFSTFSTFSTSPLLSYNLQPRLSQALMTSLLLVSYKPLISTTCSRGIIGPAASPFCPRFVPPCPRCVPPCPRSVYTHTQSPSLLDTSPTTQHPSR